MKKNKKNTPHNFEVVSGNGNDLNISPVYEHLNALKPKPKSAQAQKVIIPIVKKEKKK